MHVYPFGVPLRLVGEIRLQIKLPAIEVFRYLVMSHQTDVRWLDYINSDIIHGH